MKAFNNDLQVLDNFKGILLGNIPQRDLMIIGDDNIKLAVNYYFNSLTKLNNNCIMGLTIDETFVIRQYLGFNEEKTAYSYDEIKKIYGITTANQLGKQSLSIMRGVMKNIKKVLSTELEENKILKIMLGEIIFDKRILNLLRSRGIYTFDDLVKYSRNDLLSFKGISDTIVLEIEKLLDVYNLKLAPNNTVQSKDCNNSKALSPNKKYELELRKIGIQYQKLLLEYERIMLEKTNLEQRMEQIKIKRLDDIEIKH